MRALSSGELTAIRDNRNSWQIDVNDLEKWAEVRTGQAPDQTENIDRTRSPDQPRTIYSDTPETISRLAVAEARIEGLEARLSDTQAERDRLALLLDRALEPRPVVVAGFWARIFGK